MHVNVLTRAGITLLLASALAGCSSRTSVSGSVTYLDRPVENGWIVFQPADGQGPSAGAPIEGGRFHVDEVTPGAKIVQIAGVKAVPFARNSEDMARMAAEAAKRGDRSGLIDRADEIPATAAGNNVTIEVKPGSQTLDFHLTAPAAGG
jgi:hypothetical protein